MIAPAEKIAEARATYGRTIQEVLAKEPALGIYKILGAIEVLVGSKIHQKLPTSLAERMVFAFTWMARETQNGGFHQFFLNSAGDYWIDVLDGLVAIGDNDALARYRQVLSVFPDSKPSVDRVTRLEQLNTLEAEDEERVSVHFNRLNQEYFSDPFPKWKLVFAYVKSHPIEFDLCEA
jgi:hypothetical protein